MPSKGLQQLVMRKCLAVTGATDSNCNVQVLCFQRAFTIISIMQITKSFKPTSIPKKFWVKIYSKKF